MGALAQGGTFLFEGFHFNADTARHVRKRIAPTARDSNNPHLSLLSVHPPVAGQASRSAQRRELGPGGQVVS